MQVEVSYRLRYRVGQHEREVHVSAEGVATPAAAARELGLVTVRGRERRRVRVCPRGELRIVFCEAELRCDVASASAIYLNGYNSWTDSWERSVHDRMRGLRGVPRRVIDAWALDGSGDYRFTVADHRPGRQHGFGYGYLRYGTDVLLVGSLDEDGGYTTIRENLRQNLLTLSKEPPQRVLATGEEFEVMAFAIVEGPLDDAVGRWLALAGITPRPAPPLVGYSSWYRHYDQIDQGRLEADLASVRDFLADRDLGPCLPVFQVDDGYATVGDWTDPHEGRFPDGMGHLAALCREAQLVPGLWMAPFVCSADSRVHRLHQDWLLRDEQGQPVSTGSHWNGAFALDTLHPEVREHVRRSLWTVTHEWGHRLLKLDFLYGACMLPHGGMNRGELMADALGLLRASVDEDVLFDLCGVPISSAMGRAEYCRVGCDVGLDWDDVPWMRLLHRERVSTKRNLANTCGRAHLDGKAFRNDPDVFFLRRDVRLTDEQRYDLLSADATLGGVFLTSDDVARWDERQCRAYDLALAAFVAKES